MLYRLYHPESVDDDDDDTIAIAAEYDAATASSAAADVDDATTAAPVAAWEGRDDDDDDARRRGRGLTPKGRIAPVVDVTASCGIDDSIRIDIDDETWKTPRPPPRPRSI
jgi:hypothetical protein